MSKKDKKSADVGGENEDQDIEIASIGDEAAHSSAQPANGAGDGDVEKLQAEANKWKTDYLYLRADFDNYRKGVVKERADLVKYGGERLIVELLGFLDTFDRALELPLTSENAPQFKQGIEMTATELRNVLSRFGVQELAADGKPFNPAEHEALSSEETDKVAPGHISRVFKKAYKLHDRVIRPAQVVVAKEPAPKEG